MQIPQFNEDIAFISKLGDNPNTDNGYNSAQLKAEFDKAALAIQRFINTYIVATLNSELSSDSFLKLTGGTMKGNIAMNGNRISGLGNPTADADAVTKAFLLNYLASYVASVSNGGTGAKNAADARTNLGAAAAKHTHTVSDVSGWSADVMKSLLAAGYMQLSSYQIVSSVSAIPSNAPEGALFLVPVSEV